MAKTGKRLNGSVHQLTTKCPRCTFIFASISALSVYSTRTIGTFIGRGRISCVVGYTTCATISGTRSSRTLYLHVGQSTMQGLNRTTHVTKTEIVRISASCIFSNAGRLPCIRASGAYPTSICKHAGLTNRRTLRRIYPSTMVVQAT